MRYWWTLGLATIILLALAAIPPASTRAVATFTVESTLVGPGTNDSNTADNVCDNGSGVCTFRAAIQQANATPGQDTIDFNIPGSDPGCSGLTGVCTIFVDSLWPAITDSVILNGTTQPGWAGAPLIELYGGNAGLNADGLRITGGNSTVKGLAINRFGGDGIELSIAGGNTIVQNFIGTDPTGLVTDPVPASSGDELGNLGHGVYVNGTAGNTIGGSNGPEAACADASDDDGDGFVNDGCPQVGSFSETGVDCQDAADAPDEDPGNPVTDDDAVVNDGCLARGLGNIISGSGRKDNNFHSHGVYILGAGATGNNVLGNFIGIDFKGSAAGNSNFDGNNGSGVTIDNASGNTIGSTDATSRNYISLNNDEGVWINAANASTNIVQGNYIGTDYTGAVDRGLCPARAEE